MVGHDRRRVAVAALIFEQVLGLALLLGRTTSSKDVNVNLRKRGPHAA
jgi:hypothetical protein